GGARRRRGHLQHPVPVRRAGRDGPGVAGPPGERRPVARGQRGRGGRRRRAGVAGTQHQPAPPEARLTRAARAACPARRRSVPPPTDPEVVLVVNSRRPRAVPSWLRIDPYILALLATVAVASLLPARGAVAAGVDDATTVAIGFLFFVYGA